MIKKPNLFDFATSELSQDAIICWLLSWAKPDYKAAEPELNACAIDLLKAFFEKRGLAFPEKVESIEITKQDCHIDVLCIVNGMYPILIEDKTHTSQHSDQLNRYFEEVLQRGFDAEKVVPIYFKTRDQSDYSEVKKNGYEPFLRADLLKILNRHASIRSEVFQNFREHLNRVEYSVQSFRTLPVEKWNRDSWIGFYAELKRNISDGNWDYVANPSGGFMGFWFSHHSESYLQLEQEKFCFKIVVDDKEIQASRRWKWHEAVMSSANKVGLKVKKPCRFGKGTYMTVCVLNEEYRKTKDGLLDFAATENLIQKISDFLDTVKLEDTHDS